MLARNYILRWLALCLVLRSVYSWTIHAHNRYYIHSNLHTQQFSAFLYSSAASSFTAAASSSLDHCTLHNQPSSALYMGLRGKKIRREKRLAQKLATPPRIETPYGPIRISRPPRICDTCRGRGVVRCTVCKGRGVIRATGMSRANKVDANRLVGSLWTSVEVMYGHRHHQVIEVQGSPKNKNQMRVRMLNCCGTPQEFWLPLIELKNKSIWRMGWQTMEDIQQADGGPLLDAKVCFRCKGDRILPCIECAGQGSIPSYEPLHN
jgi:tryptophan-rich hypothetical protein